MLTPLQVAPDIERPIEDGQIGRWYGTRVSNVILVREDGQTTFIERDRAVLFDGEIQPGSERRFDFPSKR